MQKNLPSKGSNMAINVGEFQCSIRRTRKPRCLHPIGNKIVGIKAWLCIGRLHPISFCSRTNSFLLIISKWILLDNQRGHKRLGWFLNYFCCMTGKTTIELGDPNQSHNQARAASSYSSSLGVLYRYIGKHGPPYIPVVAISNNIRPHRLTFITIS